MPAVGGRVSVVLPKSVTCVVPSRKMKFIVTTTTVTTAMMLSRSSAFVVRNIRRSVSSSAVNFAEEGQAEVVLVGCGAPNRGMGT